MAERAARQRRERRSGRGARHPRFVDAVLADARIALAYRSEPFRFESRIEGLLHAGRLMWVSDSFFALAMYRLKARSQSLGVPLVPTIAHRLSMATAQVCIGDPVVVAPGIYLAHGQVVIDGITEVREGAVFFPWVTVGLRAGDFDGPVIGAHAKIGTGAKIVGPVTVGDRASVGANAVVVDDVPPDATAVGVPARVVGAPAVRSEIS
jgi:serine O-acetyltransferase